VCAAVGDLGLAQSLQAEERAGPRDKPLPRRSAVAAHLRDLIGDVLELARAGRRDRPGRRDLNLDSIIAGSLSAIDARAQASVGPAVAGSQRRASARTPPC